MKANKDFEFSGASAAEKDNIKVPIHLELMMSLGLGGDPGIEPPLTIGYAPFDPRALDIVNQVMGELSADEADWEAEEEDVDDESPAAAAAHIRSALAANSGVTSMRSLDGDASGDEGACVRALLQHARTSCHRAR